MTTVHETPLPENKRHFAGLDGLRAVAVLMVMVQHYLHLSGPTSWGWTGVRIFFVLSGFLITGILYDTRNAERRWSVFYARRALRIFPLYYGVLLFAVVTIPFGHWIVHVSWLLWPLYLQNFVRFLWPGIVPTMVADHLVSWKFKDPPLVLFYGHFWSLAIEEQFYLIWPLIVFWVKRRETLMKLCVWVTVLTPIARLIALRLVSHTALQNGFEERFTFLQFDSLLLGAFFALWMRGPHPDFTVLGRWLFWAFVGVAIVSEVASPLLFHHYLFFDNASPIFCAVGYTAINFGSMALILLAIDGRTAWSRLLQLRPLRYLGTISYGFYVFHDIPHFYYNVLSQHLAPRHSHRLMPFFLGILGTLALASASYYGFERPFLRLKDRFTIKPARVEVTQ